MCESFYFMTNFLINYTAVALTISICMPSLPILCLKEIYICVVSPVKVAVVFPPICYKRRLNHTMIRLELLVLLNKKFFVDTLSVRICWLCQCMTKIQYIFLLHLVRL